MIRSAFIMTVMIDEYSLQINENPLSIILRE